MRLLYLQIRRFALSANVKTQNLAKIGQREVVGYGRNGNLIYDDSITFPYPAIRFREITPQIKALKEKENGNWKELTLEEKKCLYRVSFCQTLAEVEAPTGEWKEILGYFLMVISAGLWLHLCVVFLTRGELPESFNTDRQIAQLRRMIAMRVNPIDGIASKWDYENDKWKD